MLQLHPLRCLSQHYCTHYVASGNTVTASVMAHSTGVPHHDLSSMQRAADTSVLHALRRMHLNAYCMNLPVAGVLLRLSPVVARLTLKPPHGSASSAACHPGGAAMINSSAAAP